ncbi:fimbrillin family protein [Proteiniphilum sp. UBA5384]|uniref:fimbrillin family protein n=1 Tax=Proteiniphilum sp. UBA5384 TaxID=1947279 RepID=UPI0025DAD83A|nr:fimbrillin family protein [Proteiniphilum sp. UBA5384]
MKTKLLSVLAITAILFASCSSDDNDLNNEAPELRISSGVSSLLKSAADTQENTIASGETVNLWVDDATTADALYKANQLTANGSNGFAGGNPMYFPQTGNNVDIYAIHGKIATPFANGDAFPTSAVAYSVETDQSVFGGVKFTNSDLLYAYSKNVARNGNPTTASLTFYHMLSKLEVAVKIGNGVPVLALSDAVSLGNNNIIVDGEFTPSITATMTNQADRAAMLAAGTTTATMQLGQLTCTDFTTANIIYNEAILVPQNMSGKVLTFNLASGGTLKYTIPAGTTFESGKKYRYEITLNLTGLQVTSTIEDWEAVNVVTGSAEMD